MEKMCVQAQCVQLFCDSTGCCLPGSSVHGISQARILEMGCHFLLRGMFLTQGLNPHLLHERQILSLVLAGWFFTTSATWEAPRNSLKTWMTIFTERRRYLKPALSFAIKILISKKKKHGRSFQTLFIFQTRLCAAAQSLRFLSIALYSHGPKDVRE